METNRLTKEFYNRDVLQVAPELVGKILARKFEDGRVLKLQIKETEAYRGEEDLACHASKGKTSRTEVMYMDAGRIYIYLIYGMYYMLNIVTERENIPQAVLIRAAGEYNGPGKLTKALQIDKEFNKQSILDNASLWIENNNLKSMKLKTFTRIGVEYSGALWCNKLWRWVLDE